MPEETLCIGCNEPIPDDERVGDGLCEACADDDYDEPTEAEEWYSFDPDC